MGAPPPAGVMIPATAASGLSPVSAYSARGAEKELARRGRIRGDAHVQEQQCGELRLDGNGRVYREFPAKHATHSPVRDKTMVEEILPY